MSRRFGGGGGNKDIRSKIKHSNANLGSGVQLERTPTHSASQAALQAGLATSVNGQPPPHRIPATPLGSAYGNDAASYDPQARVASPASAPLHAQTPYQPQSFQYQQQQQQPQYPQSHYQQPQQYQYMPEQPSRSTENTFDTGGSHIPLPQSDSPSKSDSRYAPVAQARSGSQSHAYSSSISHTPSHSQASSKLARPISPSADSQSYFRNINDDSLAMGPPPGSAAAGSSSGAHTPNRPQRSQRRPLGAPPSAPPLPSSFSGQMSEGRTTPAPPLPRSDSKESSKAPFPTASPGRDRPPRAARLIAQVNQGQSGRDTPVSLRSEEGSIDDAYGALSAHDGQIASPFSDNTLTPGTGSTGLGSLSKSQSPAALGSVLSALSEAGRKHQGRRIMRGMTAEEESRRRKVERKMDEARQVDYRDMRYYEMKARQEQEEIGRIGAVSRKLKAEWAFVAEDDFNAVALALSLLDESSMGANRREFESTKRLTQEALQGTVDDHYEAFATAITLHNSVLAAMTDVQTSVSSSRRRLRDSREALGSKRADLVQLWTRQQSVKEALRLLDTVEQLKNVPDRLEALMSEKHFLTAVSLLMRALKVINKTEMVEIGATADLRTYLHNQEGHMLEILVDELHSHLYLKSTYCDRRWKGYQPGEERLPDAKWGHAYSAAGDQEQVDGDDTSTLPSKDEYAIKTDVDAPPTKLAEFLQALSNRQILDQSNVANDLGDLDGVMASTANGTGGSANDRRPSYIGAFSEAAGDAQAAAEFDENPEIDSFLYIEMLLEALARLGKLSVALDVIHQRLPVEIHALVESTIREVESRTEPLRRTSYNTRTDSILYLARTLGDASGRVSFSAAGADSSDTSRPLSTMLRLSASETTQVQSEGEIMRDLFWTLFSKMDAVLQGHRVLHEVAGRISQRSGFKESGAGTGTIAEKLRGRLAGGERLLEVWRPIQVEVRTLLHEYLMDDTQSPTSRRNNMISINEVLRQGTFHRDRSKKLFHFSDGQNGSSYGSGNALSLNARSATAAGKKELSPVSRHEEALNTALRAFVPGLVNAAESNAAGGGTTLGISALATSLATQQRENQIFASISSSSALSSDVMSRNHRLLVKPDAFNISVLFQPALAFVDRVRVVMPSEAAGETSKGFSAFLEEFVQDVFLPQLEDKVQHLFQGAVGGSDAFQEDPSSRGMSSKPVVRSATNVVVLIDSLYSMLCTTPFHRESYSRLIIQTIVQYYSCCHQRFRDLASTEVPPMLGGGPRSNGEASAAAAGYMLSATWAQSAQLAEILAETVDTENTPSASKKLELQNLENELELKMASRHRGQTIGRSDFITSRKKLIALGHLEHSLQWFLRHISRLKPTDQSLPVSVRPRARLSVIQGLSPGVSSSDQEWRLPLSSDMAARYDTLPRTYRLLSHTILFTLRMEIRARTLHFLDLAISEGNYLVEESAAEPDPHVVDLNAELANLDDIVADSVTPEYHRFLFEGLASFMEAILIGAVKKLKAINRSGVSKMIRNILALQQNLKNIIISDAGGFADQRNGSGSKGEPSRPSTPGGAHTSSQVSFDSSRRFWELLSLSPAEMLEAVKKETQATSRDPTLPERKYGFEEVKSALQLMLGLENAASAAASGNSSATGSGSGSGSGGSGASMPASGSIPGSSGSGLGPFSAAQVSGMPTTPTSATSAAATPSSSAPAVGPSLPTLKAGTVDAKGGAVSRQKFNEYLIELHQVLEAE